MAGNDDEIMVELGWIGIEVWENDGNAIEWSGLKNPCMIYNVTT